MPQLEPRHWQTTCLPVRAGGLEFTSLADSADAAYISAWASDIRAKPDNGAEEILPPEIENAVARWNLAHAASIQEILGMSLSDLARDGGRKVFRKLMQHHFEEVRKQIRAIPDRVKTAVERFEDPTPLLDPPRYPGIGTALRAMPTTDSLTLSDRAVEMTYHERLGFPLIHGHANCTCTPKSKGRPCLQPLDPDLRHANACCHAARVGRHHAVRDLLADFGNDAKLHPQIEQYMPRHLIKGNAKSKTETFLADVRFDQPAGSTWIDVTVTTARPFESPAKALARGLRRKCRWYYGTQTEQPLSTSGIVIFAGTSRGHWSLSVQDLLRDMATKATESASDGPLFQQAFRAHLIARWRSELDAALIRWRWRAVAACHAERWA